jgi:recombination protein RecT
MNSEIVKSNIQETIGAKTPQFIASVASLVNSNPAIAECEQKSIMSACVIAAALDLPINQNLGFAYILPYKNNKTGISQAQFQMGFKGYIQLAMRSGQFQKINVTDVRQGEIKTNNRLTGEIEFEWIEENRDKLVIIGYVAYMQLNNGFSKQLYMNVAELNKHGMKFSQTMKRGFGLWKDDFDSMAKKTVLKLLLSKYAPMTIEMQKAQLADQSVVDGDEFKHVDNVPVDPAQIASDKETDRIRTHINQSESVQELELCFETLQSQPEEIFKLYKDKEKQLIEKK